MHDRPAPPDTPWDRAALLLVAVAAVAAVWAPPYLPLLDLPQHIGILADLARYPTSPRLQALYTVRLFPASNVLMHLLALPLVGSLGAESAVRVVLSAGMLAWVAGARALARAGGARSLAALPALPLIFASPLASGFVNYWLAWPLAFGVWALMLDRPTRARAFGAAGLAWLCFLAHTQVWGFLLVTAPLLAAWAHRPRFRAFALASLVLLPSIGYALAWAVPALGTTGPGDWRDPHGSIRWTSPEGWVHSLLSQTLLITRHTTAAWAAFGVAAAAAGLAAAGRRVSPVLGLGLLAALASYLLPEHARNQYMIASRMIAPAAFLLVLGASRGAGRAAGLVGLVATLAQVGVVTRAWVATAGEAAGLKAVVAEAAPSWTVVALLPYRASNFADGPVFMQAAAWHQALNSGRPAFTFAYFESSPLRLRNVTAPDVLRPGQDIHPDCLFVKGRLPRFDAYLYRDRDDRCGVGASLEAHALRLARSGAWTLYRENGPIPRWIPPSDCPCR